jgi:hypothetical protein
MIAADRAMYQAKSLGKNQVSGNPRPRRLLYRAPDEPAPAASPASSPAAISAIPIEVPEAEPAAVVPEAETPAADAPAGEAPAAAASAPAPLPPTAAAAASAMHPEVVEEDEPDPSEVRRHIATASRNLDPDYQIRRAMDAFLSPSRPNGDRG